jgi:hypothetical protein
VSEDQLSIYNKIPAEIRFIKTRWADFYRFLSSQTISPWTKELKLFMERKRMFSKNQFLATDVISMMNFWDSVNLMEACLEGVVEEKFKQAFGKISNFRRAMREFHGHGRFSRWASRKGCFYWPAIGFLGMKYERDTLQYPYLGIFLQVDPECEYRETILQKMAILDADNSNLWKGVGLNGQWPGLYYVRGLQDFLSEEDQVVCIRKFFVQCIEECKNLHDEHFGFLDE